MAEHYQVAIIGSGPGGLTAAGDGQARQRTQDVEIALCHAESRLDSPDAHKDFSGCSVTRLDRAERWRRGEMLFAHRHPHVRGDAGDIVTDRAGEFRLLPIQRHHAQIEREILEFALEHFGRKTGLDRARHVIRGPGLELRLVGQGSGRRASDRAAQDASETRDEEDAAAHTPS